MGIVCGSVSGAGVLETMEAKPYKKWKQLCLCEVVLLRRSQRLQKRKKNQGLWTKEATRNTGNKGRDVGV